MIVLELWSAADDRDLARFGAALERRDLAGALFALEGASPEQEREDRGRLLALGRDVAARLPAHASPADQTHALADVLAGDEGLRGEPSVWGEPWSSGLHQVFARRRGLPILLSAVWMEVGRIAGLQMAGIGLPGHFVVRIGGPGGVYADPYGGGRPLDEAGCRRLSARATGGRAAWSASFLAPRDARQILERVIQNLLGVHERRQEREALYRLLAFRAALHPDQAEPLLQQAQVARALGALPLARAGLEEVARRFPGTREAQAAEHELKGLGPTLLH